MAIVRVGGCPAVVAQWQSIGGSVAEYWWLSGRVLVAQAIGVLGLTSGLPFHFPLFLPQFLPLSNHYLLTLLFQREQSHMKELYIPKFLHTVSGHAETG